MAAEVVRLVPVKQKLRQERARQLLDMLGGADELELQAWELTALRRAVGRVAEPAASQAIWKGGFSMISREQTARVWDWIRELPGRERPGEVRHAFDLVLLNMRQDTGEIGLTRDELAERMKVHPDKAGRAMKVLERGGVLIAERVKVSGLRGPGVVAWRVNPHLAWNGSLQARADAVKEAAPPLLVLMEGGRADPAPTK